MHFERIERVLSVFLSVAALVLIALIIRREFGTEEAPIAQERSSTPVFIPAWEGLLSHGTSDNNYQAPVRILEFADFECNACRRYQPILESIQDRFGAKVGMVFLHFPLQYHRFSRLSARAAECAKSEGKFWEMAGNLYRYQDSLGLKAWQSIASESGVRDTAAFADCVVRTDPLPIVDSGLAVGARIKLTGTPTIIVNGWRFSSPPTEEVLARTVSDLLAGKKPEP